jgi:apoptosis-inducing factor 2
VFVQGTIAARKASYQTANGKLKKAKSVLIVGGGTVGVELAAEVAGAFGKEKHVTLVSSSAR